MKRLVICLAATFLVLAGACSFMAEYRAREQPPQSDYRNIEYTIEGRRIKLTDGLSETEAAPGSASRIITRYFGNEVRKDLNSDGREDVAFLLTQDRGGSGTFFYVVAALNTESGYVGSHGTLLGDRIAPQRTEAGPGNSIIVNYADRKSGEPMTAQPSVGKSLRLLLDPQTMRFGEVAQNFEGEADPSRMRLTMKTWNWVKALYNDGRQVVPKQPNKFTATFSNDGRFSATTDCNSMSGSYAATKDTISFSHIASTKMHCEGSQEADFAAVLANAQRYHFTSKGELIIDLKFDSGSAIFR